MCLCVLTIRVFSCNSKSLLLLNYLVRNGSERVVTSSREHIYDLRSLENYTFTDENGKDQGINVRHKVKISAMNHTNQSTNKMKNFTLSSFRSAPGRFVN